MFTYFIMIILILSTVMSLAGWTLSNKQIYHKEKLNPFECGFDNNPSYRFPLCKFTSMLNLTTKIMLSFKSNFTLPLRFFLITIMFLLFDMEMVLFLPTPFLFNQMNNWMVLVGPTLFVILLMVGLLHEWEQGSLEWSW